MNESQSRVLLYGGGACVALALTYYGFMQRVDADYLTLIGSAEVHARLGAGIPPNPADPEVEASRERLFTEAEDYLARAALQQPEGTAVWQLRGWIAMQRGQDRAAADHYLRARRSPDADVESRRMLATFAARALSNADDLDRALAVLAEDQAQRQGAEMQTATLLRARILFRQDRESAARELALEVGEAAQQDSSVARDAVATLGAFQAWDEAALVCDRAWSDLAIREYQLALLKLREGNTDNAVRLLMSAIERGRPQIEDLLTRDRDLWVEATGEQALGDFLEAPSAPAVPVGR